MKTQAIHSPKNIRQSPKTATKVQSKKKIATN